MKICWDNLEGMYLTRNGTFKKTTTTYIEKEACAECNESYLMNKHAPSIFCNGFCAQKGKRNGMYGKTHTYETKKKQSEKASLRIGSLNSMFGKIHSEETIQKMSEAMKDENNPNWKGGISSERVKAMNSFEYKQWRQAVFERDNFTCQMCDQRGGKLNAHHINNWKQFEEERFDPDSGMTLCERCHKIIHGWQRRERKINEQLVCSQCRS